MSVENICSTNLLLNRHVLLKWPGVALTPFLPALITWLGLLAALHSNPQCGPYRLSLVWQGDAMHVVICRIDWPHIPYLHQNNWTAK